MPMIKMFRIFQVPKFNRTNEPELMLQSCNYLHVRGHRNFIDYTVFIGCWFVPKYMQFSC